MNTFNPEYISTVVEGILAIVIAVTVIYLAVTGKPIPELLSQAFLVVMGIYLGKRSNTNVRQTEQSPNAE